MEIDLLLMKAGSWVLDCLPGLKWLSLHEIVQEFEKLMTKQVGIFTGSHIHTPFSVSLKCEYIHLPKLEDGVYLTFVN